MNASLLTFLTLFCFFLGYRFYARFLSQKIFALKNDELTPAQEFNDGTDFVPTQKSVLWGHHFSSIAGAAPIVGPAVAIIWGWVPALLWIIFGTVFMGAAHDFACLIVSMKNKGQSLATLSGDLISKRTRTLFLIVILFLVWMVIAVFSLIIAHLFVDFPSSVIPVNFQIIVALVIGLVINKKGGSLFIPAVLTQIILFFTIYLGSLYPIELTGTFESPILAWVVFLLVYAFIASSLPVWVLLQPRDYINSHMLIIGLGAILLGLFITQPQVVAPAFQPYPEGAPPWFPFLFITIACGAISGFHGLVSAGTTSKQVQNWQDTKAIGYGAMLGEGLLAVLATLAVSAGFSSSELWHQHYASWGEAQGLSSAISAFVIGSSHFLKGLSISEEFAQTMMSVLIISFAATSLDTATRIQRYIISEIGVITEIKPLQSPLFASGLAVFSAFILMVLQEGGKGGLLLWPLFGAANQMLAALGLIIICAYLIKNNRNIFPYLIPLLFIFTITLLGLSLNAYQFFKSDQLLLSLLSIVLLIIEVWIAVEAWSVLKQRKPVKN